jgi:hypothetical protein
MGAHAMNQGRTIVPLRLALRGLASAIGAAIWGVAVWTVVSGPAHPSNVEIVARCLPVLAATALAAKGWDWLSSYRLGTYGSLVKLTAIIGIALTGVGLIPLSFWAGRSVLKLAAGRLL